MKILCVSQNEYALIDKESVYDGLLTFGIEGCIAVSAYSPQTRKKLLIHLDKDSSINEALLLLTTLFKEDVNLKVTVVHRLTEATHLRNQTLVQIQEILTSNKIPYINATTKTGTVVLMKDGAIRLDLQHMRNRAGTHHMLALPEANKFNMLDHEIVFSSALEVQWHITNLNSMLDEVKSIHPLILSGTLNTEAELLDMRLVSILEETKEHFPEVNATQRVEIMDFIFNKFWHQFGIIICDRLVEQNNTAFSVQTAHLEPQSLKLSLLKQDLIAQLQSLTDAIKQQYKDFFSKIAFQFLPQINALKARHLPLENNEPTANLDFYTPLTYK